MVTITLIPEQFASAAERDAFFDRMTSTLARKSAEVKERIPAPAVQSRQALRPIEAG